MAREALLFVALTLAGCSEPRPVPTTPAPTSSAAVAPKPSPWDYVRDPKNWAVLSGQVPPKGFVDFHRKASRFDVGPFDEVVVYRFGFDRWAPLFAGVDQAVGCNNYRAVAPDGTLCPSFVLPGKTLDIAVGKEIVERFNAPRVPDDVEIMCHAEYHHAFVFYRDGIPVGELLVSFGCPRWQAAPGFEEHYPFGPLQHRAWLRSLCRKLDLGFCDPTSEKEFAAAVAWWKQHTDKGDEYRLSPRPLPISGSKRLRDLSEDEKLALCVWNTQHVTMSPNEAGESTSHPDAPTRIAETLNWKSCVKTFPSCETSVETMRPCMDAAQIGDPFFAHPPHAHCRKLSDCLWGWAFHDDPTRAD